MLSIKESIILGYENVKNAKSGLYNLVFGGVTETTFDTEKVDIDIYDGTRGASGFTARDAQGQTVDLEGWETINVQPPLIDESFIITAKDLKFRNIGEGGINATNTGKFQNIVNKRTNNQDQREMRKYTLMTIELLKSGKITIIEKDKRGNAKASREVNFNMPAGNIFTVATAWNASGDIFGDIETLQYNIAKESGLTADFAIIGKTTLADMVADTKIQALLDNRRINFGEMVKEDRGNGLIFWGNLSGIDHYTFVEFDEAGNDVIPASAYLMGSSMAELDVVFGSVDVMVGGEPTVLETKKAMVEISDEKAVSKEFKFKSARLPCLTQAGGFGNMTTR